MREIKFRGKRVDTGEYVYGFYFKSDVYNAGSKNTKKDLIGKDKCFILEGALKDFATPVIPETLGQYTGLKDKNGKEIYEGDRIRYYEVFYDTPTDEELKELCINEWEYGTVIYGIEQGYPAFDLDRHDFDCNAFSYMVGAGYTIEVIGTIHDKE